MFILVLFLVLGTARKPTLLRAQAMIVCLKEFNLKSCLFLSLLFWGVVVPGLMLGNV